MPCLQGGTPARFLKRDFVEERTKIVDEDKLVDLASDTEVSCIHIKVSGMFDLFSSLQL
jgi:hypothetical protein